MSYWNLEPGCERIVTRSGRQTMAMTGVGNLTPQEAARRCQAWFGARVDDRTTGKIKIYPADPAQPVITISDRWTNGNDRRNAVSRLQRAGLDVINGKPADEKTAPEKTTREDAPVTVNSTPTNGHPTPATLAKKPLVPSNTRETTETLLGMLAEAEGRITALTETVEALSQRVSRLDELEHQSRGRYAALSRRVQAIGERVDTERPMDEAARAEAERAELTNKALEFLAATGATMTAGSIAVSLDMPERGNLMGKLLATAAKEKRATLVQLGSQKLYRALPKEQA